jgi:hypothetical protein
MKARYQEWMGIILISIIGIIHLTLMRGEYNEAHLWGCFL